MASDELDQYCRCTSGWRSWKLTSKPNDVRNLLCSHVVGLVLMLIAQDDLCRR